MCPIMSRRSRLRHNPSGHGRGSAPIPSCPRSESRSQFGGGAAGRAARLDAALRDVRGQVIGRHLLAVVDAAHDQRPIRIPLEEIDDDLLADPRNLNEAPLLARPRARHAHPARALVVVLAEVVPVELDLHAAVLVDEDLLAARADDDGRLRAVNDRFRRDTARTIRDRVRDRSKRALELELAAPVAGAIRALARRVPYRQQVVRHVDVAPIVIADVELLTAAQRAARSCCRPRRGSATPASSIRIRASRSPSATA